MAKCEICKKDMLNFKEIYCNVTVDIKEKLKIWIRHVFCEYCMEKEKIKEKSTPQLLIFLGGLRMKGGED